MANSKADIDQAIESVAANIRQNAPASEWVANINYQTEVLRLEPMAASIQIAAAFGMDWFTLVREAGDEDASRNWRTRGKRTGPGRG